MLDDVAASLNDAPESAKSALKGVISSGIARVIPLADTALAKDGVGPVLAPVVEPMLETLNGLAN